MLFSKISLKKRHPYAYTLDLFRLSLDILPPGFSKERKDHFKKILDRYAKNPDCTYEELQLSIADLGRESWPYRKAYEKMYAVYGRASEESFLLERLDKGLRQRYEQFLQQGGKLNHIAGAKNADDLWKVSPFERFFTPEEKFSIGQALFSARDSAREEIERLVQDAKREEYESSTAEFLKRQDLMKDRLSELRSLSSVSAKWEPEIMDQVRVFEEGWSVVERQVNEDDLDKVLDYWKGMLSAFLAA